MAARCALTASPPPLPPPPPAACRRRALFASPPAAVLQAMAVAWESVKATAEAAFKAGEFAAAAGGYQEALHVLSAASSGAPPPADAAKLLSNQSAALQRLGDWQAAVACAQQACELQPRWEKGASAGLAGAADRSHRLCSWRRRPGCACTARLCFLTPTRSPAPGARPEQPSTAWAAPTSGRATARRRRRRSSAGSSSSPATGS